MNSSSAIAGRPLIARPMQKPTIAASLSGASRTRSPPNSSYSPRVTPKTPPYLPTSSPISTIRSLRCISSRMPWLTACANVSSAMYVSSSVVQVLLNHCLVDLDPQPWLLWDGDPAAALLEGLADQLVLHRIRQRLQLEDDGIGRGRGQMNAGGSNDRAAPGMRVDRAVRQCGHLLHLQISRDPLGAAWVDQNDVGETGLDDLVVIGNCPEILAGCDLRLNGGAQLGVALPVERAQRILDPANTKALELMRHADSLRDLHAHGMPVVDHEIDSVANRLAYRLDESDVALGLVAQPGVALFPKPDLHGRVALLHIGGEFLGHGVDRRLRRVCTDARAQAVVYFSAQQLTQRYTLRPDLTVPHG